MKKTFFSKENEVSVFIAKWEKKNMFEKKQNAENSYNICTISN